MPMAVLIRVTELKVWNKEEYKKKIDQSTDKIATNISMAIKELNPSANFFIFNYIFNCLYAKYKFLTTHSASHP